MYTIFDKINSRVFVAFSLEVLMQVFLHEYFELHNIYLFNILSISEGHIYFKHFFYIQLYWFNSSLTNFCLLFLFLPPILFYEHDLYLTIFLSQKDKESTYLSIFILSTFLFLFPSKFYIFFGKTQCLDKWSCSHPLSPLGETAKR